MTAIGRIILSGLLLSALLGCAQTPDLTGSWIGYRNLQVQPGTDPVMARNLAKVELRIDANGRFELFERGVPKNGRVEYEGGKAHLVVLESMMTPIDKARAHEFEGITFQLTPSPAAGERGQGGEGSAAGERGPGGEGGPPVGEGQGRGGLFRQPAIDATAVELQKPPPRSP